MLSQKTSTAINFPDTPVCIVMTNSKANQWFVVAPTSETAKLWLDWAKQENKDTHLLTISSNIEDTAAQTIAKKYKSQGWSTIKGSTEELTARGLVRLKENPDHWWRMTSATYEQLLLIKKLPDNLAENMIFNTLVRHGWFDSLKLSRRYKGPSPVEPRWEKVFPEVMCYAKSLRMMQLNTCEALSLFENHFNKREKVKEISLPNIGELDIW